MRPAGTAPVPPSRPSEPEPRPLKGPVPFEEGDFHALSEALAKDPQYDARRLETRRKLGTLAKAAVARISGGDGLALLQRTSLHRPTQFNAMRVRRLWAYMTRDKQAKAGLKRTLGSDLAKDLDAAYRNAYLCVALEADAIEVSLRMHPDAWYDGQNLVRRVAAEGPAGWLAQLNALDGYFLRLADWKGEWRCGALDTDRIAEFLKYYKPGDHALVVEKRWPAPAGARGAALGTDVPELLIAELERLVPLYRYSAWSDESNFLFSN